MIQIQDKIVSLQVVEEQFLCNLNACKGACCWEGDSGAPLEKEELEILEEIYDKVKPYLSSNGQKVIEENGTSVFYKTENEYGTPLINNGPCAYMTYDEAGIAQCGIEQAWADGVIAFKKPISCHLYPIRISEYESFEAVNYDEWDICKAACALGKKNKLPVYQFLKEPLIRKYGESFYEELDQFAKSWAKQKEEN